jgi:hypothetical protein
MTVSVPVVVVSVNVNTALPLPFVVLLLDSPVSGPLVTVNTTGIPTPATPLVSTMLAVRVTAVPMSPVWLAGLSWTVSLGTQACASHHLAATQSPSTLHPPSGSQVPLTLQAVDRQTTAPFAEVHGPSLFA